MQMSRSQLDSTRRSIVLSLPLQYDFSELYLRWLMGGLVGSYHRHLIWVDCLWARLVYLVLSC
jgi:hypothetical protein